MQQDQLITLLTNIAEDRKASELVLQDLRSISSICDYQFICSGSNSRHTRAISTAITKQLQQATGLSPLQVEGETEGRWIILDYGDFLVHVFQPEIRSHYDFDNLWVRD
ncbi:MAG: ribosome silencing factor [Pseudomonadota bacterium]|nr:ribosome silencing factor [Pseudomonadota bacterium]